MSRVRLTAYPFFRLCVCYSVAYYRHIVTICYIFSYCLCCCCRYNCVVPILVRVWKVWVTMATASRDLTVPPSGDAETTITVSLVERLYVKRAMGMLAASLARSRKNEVDGSEIWHLRGREIDTVNKILGKVS